MKKVVVILFILLISGCAEEEVTINSKQTNEKNNSLYQLEVTIDKINIRSESTIDSKKIGTVTKGEIYTIQDFTFDDYYLWYKIKTSDGIVGYISSKLKSMWVKILTPDTKEKEKIDIKLKGEDTIFVKKNTKYIEPGYDININKHKVKVSGEVDTSSSGIYKLTYQAVDYYGNTQSINRNVVVYLTKNMSETIEDLTFTLISGVKKTKNKYQFDFSLENKSNHLIQNIGTIKYYTETYVDSKYTIPNFELHVDETKEISVIIDEKNEIKYFVYCMPTTKDNSCPLNGIPIIIEVNHE